MPDGVFLAGADHAHPRRVAGVWLCRSVLRATAVGLLLNLGACTRPYEQPVLDPEWPPGASPHISGLLGQAASGPLKVIWIHGVCHHDGGWVDNRVALVKAALGPGTTVTGPADPVAFFEPISPLPSAYLYKRVFETSDHRILATYFVVWSPIDDPKRDA